MKENSRYYFLICTWTIFAAVFAVYDLQISQIMYNPESVWAHYIEAYGQLPGYTVSLIGVNILIRLRDWKKTIQNLLGTVFITLIAVLISFLFWADLQGMQIGKDIPFPLTLALALLSITGMQVWLRSIPEAELRTYENPSKIATLLLILAPLLTTWLFKILWDRVTFRNLSADFVNFTPWYLPRGNTGHYSFISGHASTGWLVLPLTLLFSKEKAAYQIIKIIIVIWGTVAALSRVVVGAHFASDILFGACQTILWFWMLEKRFTNKEV